ncbi:MAG: BlaI/MecI/CopY family transcriptional regulator [Bacteroidota bacterium]
MIELTKAEEQVMQHLWALKKGFLKDIIGQFPEPRPANTTIATVLRKLVEKGVVTYTTYGKIHEYRSVISQEEYSKSQLNRLVNQYFNNSYRQFASFFSRQPDLSVQDLEALRSLIDETIAATRDK